MDLKLADMWSVSGQLLHSPAYRQLHAQLLADAIGERELRILDCACGTGFPMIELYALGFAAITGSDADADLLAEFRQRLTAIGWQPELIEASWQTLPQRLARHYGHQPCFDVVLNVDAAIGFMDSWIAGDMRSGPENIFARVIAVLRNFHAVTAPGGRFFIGLQKNNHKGNHFYPMKVGEMMLDGVKAEAHWRMSYDWESRIKTWLNIVRVDGREYTQTRQSYLFDLAELADFLRAASFDAVERLPTSEDLYEDILIAHRARDA